MNKLEALNKILELNASGRRAQYAYRSYASQKGQPDDCFCAIGCLLDPEDFDEILIQGYMSILVSSEAFPKKIQQKLYNIGFADSELDEIQIMNDEFGNREFGFYIQGLIDIETTKGE